MDQKRKEYFEKVLEISQSIDNEMDNCELKAYQTNEPMVIVCNGKEIWARMWNLDVGLPTDREVRLLVIDRLNKEIHKLEMKQRGIIADVLKLKAKL